LTTAIITAFLAGAVPHTKAVAIEAIETIIADSAIAIATVTAAGLSATLRVADALTTLAAVIQPARARREIRYVRIDTALDRVAVVDRAKLPIVAAWSSPRNAVAPCAGIAHGTYIVVGAGPRCGGVFATLRRVWAICGANVLIVANDGPTGLALAIGAEVSYGGCVAVITGGDVVVIDATLIVVAEVVGTEVAVVTVLCIAAITNQILAVVPYGAGVAVVTRVTICDGWFALPGERVAGGVIAGVLIIICTLQLLGRADSFYAHAARGTRVAVITTCSIDRLVFAFPLFPIHGAEVDGTVVIVVAVEVDPPRVTPILTIPIIPGIEVGAVGVVFVETLPFWRPAPLVSDLLLNSAATLLGVTAHSCHQTFKGRLAQLFQALLLALFQAPGTSAKGLFAQRSVSLGPEAAYLTEQAGITAASEADLRFRLAVAHLLRGGIGIGRVWDPGAGQIGAVQTGIGTFVRVVILVALAIIAIIDDTFSPGTGLTWTTLGRQSPALSSVHLEDGLTRVDSADAYVLDDTVIGVQVGPHSLTLQRQFRGLCCAVILLAILADGPLEAVGRDVGRVTVGDDVLVALATLHVARGGGADVAVHLWTFLGKEVGAKALSITRPVFKTALGAGGTGNGVTVLAITGNALNLRNTGRRRVAVCDALAQRADDNLRLGDDFLDSMRGIAESKVRLAFRRSATNARQ